jgi:hypothetical protein
VWPTAILKDSHRVRDLFSLDYAAVRPWRAYHVPQLYYAHDSNSLISDFAASCLTCLCSRTAGLNVHLSSYVPFLPYGAVVATVATVATVEAGTQGTRVPSQLG